MLGSMTVGLSPDTVYGELGPLLVGFDAAIQPCEVSPHLIAYSMGSQMLEWSSRGVNCLDDTMVTRTSVNQ